MVEHKKKTLMPSRMMPTEKDQRLFKQFVEDNVYGFPWRKRIRKELTSFTRANLNILLNYWRIEEKILNYKLECHLDEELKHFSIILVPFYSGPHVRFDIFEEEW